MPICLLFSASTLLLIIIIIIIPSIFPPFQFCVFASTCLLYWFSFMRRADALYLLILIFFKILYFVFCICWKCYPYFITCLFFFFFFFSLKIFTNHSEETITFYSNEKIISLLLFLRPVGLVKNLCLRLLSSITHTETQNKHTMHLHPCGCIG